MGRILCHCILGLLLFTAFQVPPVYAYLRTLGLTGRPLSWNINTIVFSANPTNASGLNSNDMSTIFNTALNGWLNHDVGLHFQYSQSAAIPPRSGNDGVNTVYFSTAGGRDIGFNVIAETEVLYNVASGTIVGFDMIFNDLDFLFTAKVGDTGKIAGGFIKIYLGDVATHEIGHAFGLDHSTVHRSSMMYTAFTGQLRLGKDDLTGIRTLYPAPGTAANFGAINGNIRGLRSGIFGAHVSAINLATGQVEAGTLSQADGSFNIGMLPAGQYAVYMEPYLVSTDSISIYWANVDHHFCGGRNFARAFYSACGGDGQATVVDVRAGATTAIGVITPSCSAMENAGKSPDSLANAKIVDANGGAAFASIGAGADHFYRLNNISGDLVVRVLSYTLFSPVDVAVDIADENGNPVPGISAIDNVEEPMPGGVNNFDSLASAVGLAPANYLVHIHTKSNFIQSFLYPAGSQLLDANGFYLAVFEINGSRGLASTTDMGACVNVANIPQSPVLFVSQSGPASSKKNIDATCGSIATDRDGPTSPGSLLFIAVCACLGQLILQVSYAISLARFRPKR